MTARKKMHQSLAIVGLLVLAGTTLAKEIPTVRAERVGMSTERLERVAQMNQRYIDEGKFVGIATAVVSDGKLVHQSVQGNKGINDPRPLAVDDLFRIYSMTKPITAVAMMQLYEQGKFLLTDPVSNFLPEFKNMTVLKDGEVVPAEGEMTMRQLLTHTTGLTYGFGFDPDDALDKMYGEAKLWHAKDLDDFIERLAALPLRYEPGERWHYSVAIDVAGAVVQRLSGKRYDVYLQDHIFEPLDMVDTSFTVPADKMDRFLPLHIIDSETGLAKAVDEFEDPGALGYAFAAGCRAMCNFVDVTMYSGGGGLVSTLRDYVRFAEAIRNGGILDGKRILSPKTIAFMTMDHVPASINGGASITRDSVLPGIPQNNGWGMGLGFGLVMDTVAQGHIGSTGQYYGGGAASTIFWIDPVEDIVVVSMMQLMVGERGNWSYRPDLRVSTYQAITESRE